MPSIKTASEPVLEFPNLFVSPYGNDGVIPLYSSIPIDNRTTGLCLPCVVCGNSNTRLEIIAVEAAKVESKIDDSVAVTLF
jgi:hypothetical protein